MEPTVLAQSQPEESCVPKRGNDEFPVIARTNPSIPNGFPPGAWTAGANGVPIGAAAHIPPLPPVLTLFTETAAEQEFHCFAPGHPGLTENLLTILQSEVRDYYLYRILAAKSRRSPLGRLYQRLQERQKKLVKRLSTVYYLISGQQYQKPPQENFPNLSDCLRGRYHHEARTAKQYKNMSKQMTDPCMRDLFWEVSEEKDMAAEKLLTHIENSLE